MSTGVPNPLRFLFPAILTLGGLTIVYSAVIGGQNVFWLMGGLLITLVGVFVILMMLDKLPNALQKGLFIAFIPLALITAFFTYQSIDEPIKFNVEKNRRYTKVIEHIKVIRDWQLAYKSVYKVYAPNFDSLLQFVNTGEFPVIKALGTVPDTLTENEAVKLGIVERDTILVPARDSLFKSGGDINDVRYIPYSDKVEFQMAAGVIEKGQVQVPVFEVFARNEYIFSDIEPLYYKLEDGIKVGSMTDPSTSGNWE
ncbi:MAG: hypothetical protein K9J06_09750 [Flavobacteriales bacterium]|nr:hypothetical protein [Flavobacteriales bacterium]